MKFVNKEDIIEAIQFTGDIIKELEELEEFVNPYGKLKIDVDGIYLIDKFNKLTKIYKNNYILKRHDGVWVCDSDRFNSCYIQFKDPVYTLKSDFGWSVINDKIIMEELNKLHDKYNVNLTFKNVDSQCITILLTNKILLEPVEILLNTNTFMNFNESKQRNYIYSHVETVILREMVILL